MSLSTYYLEHGSHVARLHRRRRCRRARPQAILLATITMRKFMGFLYFLWVWGSAWRPLAAVAPL